MRRTYSAVTVLAAAALALVVPEARSAQTVSYLVTVVTSEAPGPGFLEFQFNPGVSSQPASVAISNLTPSGAVTGSPVNSGNVSGTLPPSITLTNSTPFNDQFVGYSFGGTLTFQVTFSGPAIAAPSPSFLSGSSFGFSVYASNGVTPQLTPDSAGFLFTININPDGTTTVKNNSASSSVTSTTTVQTAEVFVTNAGGGSVSVIDPATNQVKATVSVGLLPAFVALSPDNSRAYVAVSGANSVAVINTATNTVVATVPVGHTPVQLAVSPDGSRVYVANSGSNSVSVINTGTNTVAATVSVGHTPVSLSISADGGTVYVANSTSNSISVIKTSTNTVAATVSVGSLPANVTAQ